MSFRFPRSLWCAATLILATVPSFSQISINEVFAENKDLPNSDGSISDWVELYNDGSQAASLAGYSLTDTTSNPLKWIVPQNVSVPAKGFLLVLLDSSRPGSTTSVPLLNAGFSLKGSGDRIDLYAPGGQLVESVRFGPQAAGYSIGRVPAGFRGHTLCIPSPGLPNVAQPLGSQTDLRINEWMASPSSGKDWFELFNPGTLPVQLSGLNFTDDGNIPSPVAPLSYIGTARAGYLRFNAENSTNDNEVTFKLSGSGDSISLFTAGGAPIDSVHFGQQSSDISQGRLPDGSDNVTALGTPTPGESNLTPFPGLVVNELLSHTDPPLEDAVEFYNQTDAVIEIGGWYLSNKRSELKKYRIPGGTSVPAKGYLVIYEEEFNRKNDPNAFTFNSAKGDEVYLSQADAAGTLSGQIVSEEFEPAENAVSFGRYETSAAGDYKFVAMAQRTFGSDNPLTVEQFRTGTGAPNSSPRIGPVVINEIMYHPRSTLPDGSENTADEFIEFRNLTGQTVPLYDPAHPENPWKLRGGVSFSFPAGASLAPLAYALAVSFDPADVAQLGAFRANYSVPSGVQIFGPYSGKLNNGGDAVELYKPDPPQLPPHPDAGLVPYIRVDKVNYRDVGQWPTEADGTGNSLQRKNSTAFGNDPINWQAAIPTGGKSNSAEVNDTDGDGIPDVWETENGFNPNNPGDAADDVDADGFSNLAEYVAGTDPRSAASRLEIGRIRSVSPETVEVTFPSVAGKSYSVQYRNNLLPSSSWQSVASVQALGTETSVQDTGIAGRNARFYRIVTPAAD